MDPTAVGAAVPSWTNKGAMKSDGCSRTSCTISRMAAPRRNRRARRAGNPAELMSPLWRIVARDTNRVPGVPSEGEGGRGRFSNWVRRKLTRTALVFSHDQLQLELVIALRRPSA
jgi:hypothetical protein